MELDYGQFVDFCIMCGCDYTETIRGIGPKTALALIRKHKTIGGVLEVRARRAAAVRRRFRGRQRRRRTTRPTIAPLPDKTTDHDEMTVSFVRILREPRALFPDRRDETLRITTSF